MSPPQPSTPTPVPLDAVITTEELRRRPFRPPDHEAESRALADIMQVLAETVGAGEDGVTRMLQTLVERALRLCRASSAGVSILEEQRAGDVFRWRAVAGEWARFIGGSMPRASSPCGVVLDRNTPMLMSHPERHFLYDVDAPPMVEALLVPFHHEGRPVGTIWIIAHDDTVRFDREDQRLLTGLSRFAALAYHLLSERRLSSDLHAARRLQEVSTQMIAEGDVGRLYEKILDAAVEIMGADFGSIQVVERRPDAIGLALLASRGFTPDAIALWSWVGLDPCGSTWGAALRSRARVVSHDLENDPTIDTRDQVMYAALGIRSCQSTPLVSRGGVLVGMISTHWRDCHRPTERDFGSLDVLARQAADLIEKRTIEQTLRDADRQKDAFLAALAHELRNPLAPMMTSLELLDEDGDLEGLEARDVIRRQMGHLVRLVDDLLDVSRMTRGRLELKLERVELKSIVRDALQGYEPSGLGVRRVEVDVPADPIPFDGDHVRLVQAIGNLFNNAWKYTAPGGRIVIAARREDGELVVRVADDGIGIAPEQLTPIFDMYVQGDRPSESAGGGLGIGLALTRRIVELHGGSIRATSEGRGQGSEFTMRLPLGREVGPAGKRREVVTANAARIPRRILVVDDNPDTTEVMARILNRSGAETHVAHDGEMAVTMAEQLRPDVVVLDIGLPKLNGYQACRAIREKLVDKPPMMIALTGWGQTADRQRSADAGFDHHLTKPIRFEELSRLLAR
jgi:signal transduction histidine kinase